MFKEPVVMDNAAAEFPALRAFLGLYRGYAPLPSARAVACLFPFLRDSPAWSLVEWPGRELGWV